MKTQLGSVLAKFSIRHNVMTNPRSVWCVLLLGLFFMLKVKGMQYQPQYHPACEQRSQVCGRNTQCSMVGGRPVCSCLPGHHGNPITGCQKGDCEENRDCSNRRSCVNNECVNPCNLQVCGVRAQCDVENHVPVCSCPQRYTGNPFQYCNEIDPSELKPRTSNYLRQCPHGIRRHSCNRLDCQQ
uniref:EGF-like domain-containing protein n=2 Tax=Timema TaxID=61471 RepID=A0A7R9DEV0_TIMPO|nr:unnamed protein product [Timema douglasi]CAD7413463.1 unnamed protein product [Timema poppensis]